MITTNFFRIILVLSVAMLFFIEGFGESTREADSLALVKMIQKADSLIQLDVNSIVAEKLVNQSFENAKQIASTDLLLDLIGQKGLENRKKYRFYRAIFWHEFQEEFALQMSNQLQAINAKNNLGLIYRRMDRYSKAIKSYQEALLLSDSLDFVPGYVYATNGLGNIYLALGNYDEAMRNFRECLQIEQSQNNLVGVAMNLNNIGHVYMNQNDLNRALEYFILSMEVNREINSQRGVAISYNDIGEVFLRKGNSEKALNYFLHSLQLNKSENDLYYLAINNLKVAEIHLEAKSFAKAEPYVAEAIKNALQTNNRSTLKDAYKYMYQIQRRKGNTQNALEMLEKATILNDSILNENIQKTVFQMQTSFNREQTDNKIALLKNEKDLADLQIKKQELNNLLFYIILGFLVFVILMLVFFLNYISQRNKLLRGKNVEIEEAQGKLRIYTEQLLMAKQEAERNNKLKSQFLANMSHEIRTPMNSVIGFSDILSRSLIDKQQLSYLQSIRSSGQSLLVLIDDILDLSKIESGKFSVEYKELDVRYLINEVKLVFEPIYAQKNLELELDIDEQLPQIILFSDIYLRQILFNLIGNAIKFTEKGKITLKMEVTLKATQSLSLDITISDTGIGLEDKELNHIFDAFYQSESTKNSTSGTGLGLTITKRLITAMGGTIKVISTPRVGTTFYLSFPSVDFVPEKTNLRYITSKNMQQLSPSPLALFSNDLDIKVHCDRCFTDLKMYCDVYPDNELFILHSQTHSKMVVIIDAFELKKIQNQPKSLTFLKQLELPLVVVYKSDFPIETLDVSLFNFDFILPESTLAFTDFLNRYANGQKDYILEQNTIKIQLDVNDDKARKLVQMHQKAHNGHFVRDAADFAQELHDFAKKNEIDALVELANSLTKSYEAFDVEKIVLQLQSFADLTNSETFMFENQIITPGQAK